MHLNSAEKIVVEGEILNQIGGRRIKTKAVVDDVFGVVTISSCEKCNISGIISGMAKRGIINCKNGYCW